MRMRFSVIIGLIFINMPQVFSANSQAEIDKKVEALVEQMTLAEKIGQMTQKHMGDPMPPEYIRTWIREGKIGSFLNPSNDTEIKNEVQKIAVEESRLGIPILYARDVIHGFRTVFPIPLGQSCSWNPELVEKAARIAAIEATSTGIRWTFAPMIDITYDPRWGRIAETCGEDPYLTGKLGAAMVRGFQSNSLSNSSSMLACAKHYVGYGVAEGGRDYNTTLIPERQLRNVYLRPFKAALDAGVGTFMSAFNDINGVPASGNAFTLRTILKGEWEFQGFVVSDWQSMTEMWNHGFCSDTTEVSLKSIQAGVDMEMVSTAYQDHLEQLIADGKVSMALVDEAVKNILRIKFALGLFDNPYVAEDPSVLLTDDHLKTAKALATESVVLLKNEDGVLPLVSPKHLAVIGPLADSPVDQMGTWTPDGHPQDVQTPLSVLKNKFKDQATIHYSPGLKTSRDMSEEGFEAALAAAKQSDVILFFGGEEQILSGEARCRAFLNLPGAQDELIAKLAETGKPIILVVIAGRPLTFQEAASHADAILYAFHPGTMGGPALVDLLFGDAVPSGKLTTSFPKTVGQIPTYYSHKNTGRPATNDGSGIPLGTPLDPQGFTSRYLDASIAPEYPFGYGLSYTTFEYGNLKISKPEMAMGDSITVSVDVTNTGKMDAKETVQLYVRDLFGSVTRPVKELKGFEKIDLKAGETKTVAFTLNTDDLAFYDINMNFTAEPGKFQVWIGPNSQQGLQGEFRIIE